MFDGAHLAQACFPSLKLLHPPRGKKLVSRLDTMRSNTGSRPVTTFDTSPMSLDPLIGERGVVPGVRARLVSLTNISFTQSRDLDSRSDDMPGKAADHEFHGGELPRILLLEALVDWHTDSILAVHIPTKRILFGHESFIRRHY